MSRRRRDHFIGGNALTDFRAVVAAAGGDANILGFYDCRYGVTAATGTVLSGTVSTWDDCRGASGYGPQLVADGGTKPSISVTGAAGKGGVGITTDGSTNGFATTASAYWSLDQKLWIAYLGTVNGAGTVHTVTIDDATRTNYLGLRKNGSNIGTDYALATSAGQYIFKTTDASQRLVIGGSGSGGVTLEVAGMHKFWQPDAAAVNWPGRIANVGGNFIHAPNLAGASSNKMLLFGKNGSGGRNADASRFFIVGKGDPTRAIALALKTFADTYHTPAYVTSGGFAGPGAYVEGDSISYGANLATPATQNWFAQVLAQAGFSTYASAAVNYGNAGISGWFLNYINGDSDFMVESTLGVFRSKDVYFLAAGTNDLCASLPTTGAPAIDATATIALLKTIATRRRATGAKVVIVPPIPRADVLCTSQVLAYMHTVSDWCHDSAVSGGYADGVPNFRANANFNVWTFGADSATLGVGSIYQADKIHPLLAGHTSMAADIYACTASFR